MNTIFMKDWQHMSSEMANDGETRWLDIHSAKSCASRIQIFVIESSSSESSSEASIDEMNLRNLIRKAVESSARNLPSASNQNLDVLCTNRDIITNDNDALEMLQVSVPIPATHVTGSQVPDASASAQAPINELPRNSESKEDVAVASAQPSKRHRKHSPRATTSKNTAIEERVPRRSSRIRYQNEARPRRDGRRGTRGFIAKCLLHKELKRDEYVWNFIDSDDEELYYDGVNAYVGNSISPICCLINMRV
ncbi:hypothetical protein M9H77_01399 [Catharanthus roseus]|uniref:Uncharacterized protein n=1 Tax=Catharanthus roseus TaxID=4058 RepID=A0ACC0C5N9_CATRO|nr:hypothetical protein M9H77_01399 [Catharanthus roseus]